MAAVTVGVPVRICYCRQQRHVECSAPIHCEGTPLAALSLQASAEVAARRAHHPAGIILGVRLDPYPKHSVQETETSD